MMKFLCKGLKAIHRGTSHQISMPKATPSLQQVFDLAPCVSLIIGSNTCHWHAVPRAHANRLPGAGENHLSAPGKWHGSLRLLYKSPLMCCLAGHYHHLTYPPYLSLVLGLSCILALSIIISCLHSFFLSVSRLLCLRLSLPLAVPTFLAFTWRQKPTIGIILLM